MENQQFKGPRKAKRLFKRRPLRQHSRFARYASINLLRCIIWLLIACTVVIGVALLRLSFGPVSTSLLSEPAATALSERLSRGWTAKIGQTGIALSGHGPALTAENIEIHRPDGTLFLQADAGEISVNPWQLLSGNISVAAIALSGLDLRLVMMPGGGIQTGDNASPPVLPIDETSSQPARFEEALIGAANLLSDQTGLTRSLDKVSLSRSRLTLVDLHGQVRAVFKDVTADLARISNRQRTISLSLKGAENPWSIKGRMTGNPGEMRKIALHLSQAPLTDLLMLSGIENAPITGDVAFSSDIDLAISADNTLVGLKGSVSGSPGTLLYEDRDQPPLDLTALHVEFERDDNSGDVLIPSFTTRISEADFALKGRVTFPPSKAGWRLELDSQQFDLPPLSAHEAPVDVEAFTIALNSMPGGGVNIERMAVTGEDFGIALHGELGGMGKEGSVSLGIQAAPSNVKSLLRFWPAFVTPELRRYLIENLREGTTETLDITINLTKEQLAASRRKEPLPADTVNVQFSVANITLQATPDFPPIENASAKGIVTGNAAEIRAPSATIAIAKGEALSLSEMRMKLPRLVSPVPATIDFGIKGSVPTLTRLMQREALQPIFNFDLDPHALKGQANLKVSLALPLIKDVRANQITTHASGRINQLSLSLEKGKERLTNGDLELKLDPHKLVLTGNGKIDGLPASILINQPLKKNEAPPSAAITIVFDEALRSKYGFNFGKQLTGSVIAKISLPLGKAKQGKNRPLQIDLDLTQASINHLLPGWMKAANTPGHLSFSAIENNGYALSDIVLDAGISAKGSAFFTAERKLRNASLSSIKFSPNDDLALVIENTDDIYRLSAHGNLLDARPFLRLIKEDGAPQLSGTGINLDLTAAINILAGFNSEAISKAAFYLSMRANEVQSLRLAGSFSGAELNAEIAENDKERLVVNSSNAGAILRFADIYSYMNGGSMQAHVGLAAGGTGQITIRNFVIRNEPTMGRILTESPKKFAVDPGNVAFTKLRVNFSHAPGRIHIQEGVMWGPGVGVTIEGNLDTRSEQMNLSGTYVPAYALNNIFSQIPIIGTLLGGGQYEGLFAINFRAQGPFAAPSLTINPLSAIAPGIFRKFFDIRRAE